MVPSKKTSGTLPMKVPATHLKAVATTATTMEMALLAATILIAGLSARPIAYRTPSPAIHHHPNAVMEHATTPWKTISTALRIAPLYAETSSVSLVKDQTVVPPTVTRPSPPATMSMLMTPVVTATSRHCNDSSTKYISSIFARTKKGRELAFLARIAVS